MKTNTLVLSLLTIVMFLASPIVSAYSISNNTQTLAWFNKDKVKDKDKVKKEVVKSSGEKHPKKHKKHKKLHKVHEVKPQSKMLR